MEFKKGQGRPRKKERVKTIKRNMVISEMIDSLIIQESIIRNVAINTVINDIIVAHYTNNTLQMKYLRAILTELSKKKGSEISDELLNLNAFDKLMIPKNEIQASKFPRKRPTKKFVKKEIDDESKIDIFNLDTLKNPLK